MPGKHSQELLEIKKLNETIELLKKEIRDIKVECAGQFEKIKDLCFINDYNDKYLKLRKIHEIASDNFSALVKDLVIFETDEDASEETPKGKAKIIELPNTRKSNK